MIQVAATYGTTKVMPKKKMITFEVCRSNESFKSILNSLSRRGHLRRLEDECDVKIVSQFHSESEDHMTWMVAATPRRVMRLRDLANERREKASGYAEINEVIRESLTESYTRDKNRLDEEHINALMPQFRLNVSDLEAEYSELIKSYSTKLEKLNQTYEENIKKAMQPGMDQEQYFWKRYLRYLGQYHRFQSKYGGSVWFDVYNFSSAEDGVTVDVFFSCGSIEVFQMQGTALTRIADVVIRESGGTIIESAEKLQQPSDKKGKQGPRTYSWDEKEDAALAWEKIDRDLYPITVDDFLGEKFGYSEDGKPNVSKSTFYRWRNQLRKMGLIQD
jgi:hypothetical protein